MRTVVQALEDAAKSAHTGFRFIEESKNPSRSSRTPASSARPRATAGAMQALGLKKGDRVALILPDNQDFVFAFLGAMRAGIVPGADLPAGRACVSSAATSTTRCHIVAQERRASRAHRRLDIRRLLGTVQGGAPESRARSSRSRRCASRASRSSP